jgi:cytoskeletal protein RodZ
VSVGETLSHARRTRGLSVDDISADTRIRASLIAAIEADNFLPCGGTVYARGHVRNIAKVLGLDDDAVIHDFDVEQHVEPFVLVTAVPGQPTDRALAAGGVPHRLSWSVAAGAALVVVCAVAAVGLVPGHGGAHHAPKQVAGSSGQSHPSVGASNSGGSGAAPSGTSSGSSPTNTTTLPTEQASMVVKTLRGKCWLEIKSSKTGAILFSGTLPAGERRLFENRHGFSVVIGNAPAVDVVVNGHDIGSPTASGSVAQGDVTPGASTIEQA